MVSLTSLPLEILLEIFSQKYLTDTDAARATAVCSLFHNVIRITFRRAPYVFKIDALGFPTWRLIRCLLVNRYLGERFTHIRVKWERRNLRRTDLPVTPRWIWTRDETAQIQQMCDEFNLRSETQKAILQGVNSESLLPFLFCLVPNLETINMGCIVPVPLLCDGFWMYRVQEIPGILYLSAAVDTYPHKIDYLWLYTLFCDSIDTSKSIKTIDWPIGIRNLKKYVTEISEYPETFGRQLTGNIWPVLFFPRIETIKIWKIESGDLPYQKPMKDYFRGGPKSLVKKLRLYNAYCTSEDLLFLAQSTSALEEFVFSGSLHYRKDSVLHLLKDEHNVKKLKVFEMERRNLTIAEINMNLIGEEFLESNQMTLKESGIYITLYAIDGPLEWGGGLALLENGDSDGDSDEEGDEDAGNQEENESGSETENEIENEVDDQM
ncbi:hypothetical protein TWF694_008246 [Orbilia ellipsospora]|uniref:F-box domain-containing protein n=1 Tax=Orbilia ellipsospora TaxID=2528407 RepID=A0AAV9XFI1_9PEZI